MSKHGDDTGAGVSIGGQEFIRRVVSGEPITGLLITEPVIVHAEPHQPIALRSLHWQHCVFQHGVSIIAAGLQEHGETVRLRIEHCDFAGGLQLLDLQVGATAVLDLSSNRCTGNLYLSLAPQAAAVVHKHQIILDDCLVDGGVTLNVQTPPGTGGTEQQLAVCAVRLRMQGAFRISGTGHGQSIQRLALRSLDLFGARIGGSVILRLLTLTSMRHFHDKSYSMGLRYAHAQDVIFDDIDVAIPNAALNTMADAQVSALNCRIFDVRDVQVAGELLFRNVRGRVALDSDRHVAMLDLSGSTCAHLGIIDSGLRGTGDGYLPVIAKNAQIQADATIRLLPKQETKGTGPVLDFSHAHIATIELTNPPPQKVLNLRGTKIGSWRVSGLDDRDVETATMYLNLLETLAHYESSIYSDMEARLAAIGQRGEADKIHVAKRIKEEKLAWEGKRRLRWFGSKLHWLTLVYGTRPFLRPLLALASLFVLSCALSYANFGSWFQLSAERIAQLQGCGAPCAERLDRAQQGFTRLQNGSSAMDWQKLSQVAGISARNLVPVVEFQVGGGIEPISNTAGSALMIFLRFCGWILWPILFSSALVTVIHSRHRS